MGTPRRVLRDHSYSKVRARAFATQTMAEASTSAPSTSAPSTSAPSASAPSTSSSPERLPSESDVESDSGARLVDYHPSTETESESTSDPDRASPAGESKKYIVFEENLDELHRFCKECGSPVTETSRFVSGSLVGYRISCHAGHSYVWRSQPHQHELPLGNLMIAAAILIIGCTFAKIGAFASALNLQLFGKSVFNRIQRFHLLPVVQEAWAQERARVVAAIRPLGRIVLGEDARCDSPGHTAKYGSYTLMHTDSSGHQGTRKIVSMKLVQVSEVIGFYGLIK